jgi:NitT/TauT family transport system ATP-binding protein
MSLISARGLTRFFPSLDEDGNAGGITAVLSVNLDLAAGSFTSLVGPSGCGKSTLLEMLAGITPPSDGEVRFDGRRLLDPLPASRAEADAYARRHRFLPPQSNGLLRDRPRHDLAMIFQDYAVFPWMTALGNVLFALGLRGRHGAAARAAAQAWLARVGLRGAEHKYPAQLSGGMRQRLALARALAVKPRALLMDEPFAAVDAHTREELQDELLRLWQGSGITVVLVTHDLDEAVYLSDQVVVLSPQPGTLRNTLAIDIPRPRDRDDPLLAGFVRRLHHIYRHDRDHACDYSI